MRRIRDVYFNFYSLCKHVQNVPTVRTNNTCVTIITNVTKASKSIVTTFMIPLFSLNGEYTHHINVVYHLVSQREVSWSCLKKKLLLQGLLYYYFFNVVFS